MGLRPQAGPAETDNEDDQDSLGSAVESRGLMSDVEEESWGEPEEEGRLPEAPGQAPARPQEKGEMPNNP